MKTFTGSMTALATPFKDGKLDEASYRSFVEFQLTNGTDVLIPMGTTGEAVTMSAPERDRAIQLAIEVSKGRAPVVAETAALITAARPDDPHWWLRHLGVLAIYILAAAIYTWPLVIESTTRFGGARSGRGRVLADRRLASGLGG